MKKNIILSSLFFIMFLIVDIVGYLLWDTNYISPIQKIIVDFGYLAFLISALLASRLKFIMLGIFLLSLIDLGHFYLFQVHLLPYEWKLFFISFYDVLNALINNVSILFLLLFTFTLFSFVLFRISCKKYYLADVVVVILLLFPFTQTQKMETFLPSNKHSTYFNALFSLDREIYSLFVSLPSKDFTPYIYKKTETEKPLIIVVMGESLNYKRMHLYGWKIPNTPYLDSLSSNSNFLFKKAISYATETTTSIGSFFYNKREPENIEVLHNSNLIDLAHKNGYKTYWLSMQLDRGGLLPKLYSSSDLHFKRKDFKRKYDDSLVQKFKSIKLSKKSFVILHLRANHYYYEDYTPSNFYKWDISDKKDYHRYMVNSYMNSILYIDTLLYDIIGYLNTTKRNFVFYFTSDHGERLGFADEKGKYLHIELDKTVSYVPFLYYSNKYKKNLEKEYYAHYEISKMITEDLGYKLINPNEDNNTFYINAPQFDGSAGYIKYNLNKWKDK